MVLSIFATALFSSATRAAAQTEKVLHSFNFNGKDGWSPYSRLIFDTDGNLYGTTYSGGTDAAGSCVFGSTVEGCGTVFELSPKAGGGWTEKVLHSFNDNGTDGTFPMGGLVLGAGGNLYGTTSGGGTYNYGTVFELSPKAGGGWTEKILHSFDSSDGYFPSAGLIFDTAGNLYGTAPSNFGMVFELSPGESGSWAETMLYGFGGGGGPWRPTSGLIFDASGNLYGTTGFGGNYTSCYENAGFGCGTVYELSPGAGGAWVETMLWSFGSGTDGYYPDAGLVLDAKGNLYGTAPYGGDNTGCQYGDTGTGCGIAFELSLTGGVWTEKILHNFGASSKDGTIPYASLTFDSAGNLYGTTEFTGVDYAGGYGTVFKLSPATGGHWTEKILHTFGTNGKSGAVPYAGLIFDSAGNLYGTTYSGGAYGYGVVFEVTP